MIKHNNLQLAPRHAWGQQRRLAFIEFRLMWEGKVNRGDLKAFFGISSPQASTDLQQYVELQGSGIKYDASQRTYVQTDKFQPKLVDGRSESFLSELLAIHSGFTDTKSSFIGTIPTMDVVPLPMRAVDPKHLTILLKCIRDKLKVDIFYQSMRRAEPCWRSITPHALAWDGMRWHVRAYSDNREKFVDYVLGRILEIGKSAPSKITPDEDFEWNNFLTVVLVPHPEIEEGARNAIEMDYKMVDGELRIKVRQSMLMYVFQRLGLRGSGWEAPPYIRQIDIANFDSLKEYLPES